MKNPPPIHINGHTHTLCSQLVNIIPAIEARLLVYSLYAI